jgi:DNA primase
VGIVDEDIERVRTGADIVAIASERLALRKSGQRWVGLCPFHPEKSPSFSINGEANLYYCFGCQAKGDVITFVREIEHLDFVGAVEWLAARQGVQLRYDNQRESGDRKRRSRLVEAMESAVEWYHDRLLSAPDAAHARGYLRSRGYDGDTVRAYRMGWAPDDWDALARALKLPDDVFKDTGLGFLNRRNRQQDAFRARVLFPIFDAQGDPVAFGGRVLPGGDGPKYKNSPQTALYDKSKVLYGLNWAKGEVVAAGEVLVCEGYTDAIGFAQAGLGRAVATCGTSLTEDHVRLLKRFAPRVVLAFDADAAGQGAAERFYEWEDRYEVQVAVADLPPGADPGDLARTDPDRLRQAVAGAKPFLEFRLERVLGGADLTSAEGRARAAERALALIREHPSELVRDQYVMAVGFRCQIDADRLRAGLARPGLIATADRATRAERPPRREEIEGPELMLLRLAVHDPEAVAAAVDLAVLDAGAPVLFEDEVHLAAYRALAGATSLHAAIEAADPAAADLLQRVAVEEVTGLDAGDVVRLLVRQAATRALTSLEAVIRATPEVDLVRAADWLRRRMEELFDPDAGRLAVGQLVPWLLERAEEG